MNRGLSQATVREFLRYEPETGLFIWIKSLARKSLISTIAGTKDRHGHIRISLQNHLWGAHRLAWLYVYGRWPYGVIDHINGRPADNRISNLRDVSQAVNLQNQRTPKRGSKTGVVGVSWDKKRCKYYAQISLNGRSYKLGRFDTLNEARDAYLAAKKKLHGGYPMERAA